jgi:hypothetical protein
VDGLKSKRGPNHLGKVLEFPSSTNASGRCNFVLNFSAAGSGVKHDVKHGQASRGFYNMEKVPSARQPLAAIPSGGVTQAPSATASREAYDGSFGVGPA